MNEGVVTRAAPGTNAYDVIVIGAGAGGIYAVHRIAERGMTVLGLERAPDVGGVWYHNRYPGARVDVEAYHYCFLDPDLYAKWTWTERYPSQPEILSYLRFAADEYGIRPFYRFSTWMTGATWDPAAGHYVVRTDDGATYTCRFLIMATGQLSRSRTPSFAGLETFEGRWVQTSEWPDEEVAVDGQRVGVFGTGSSGVQVIPQLAKRAARLTVFQRTANFSVPAQNGPVDAEKYAAIAGDVDAEWRTMRASPIASDVPLPTANAADLSPAEQRAELEACWARGGHSMNAVFADQARDYAANTLVADFVRAKVRDVLDDPKRADVLLPTEYPIGSRRLCVDTGYYEAYNRDNVEIVNLKTDPVERITPRGVLTRSGREHELDLIVFALGFDAFTGALAGANIRNEKGQSPTDLWSRGPRTYLGLMTHGFPNLFLLTGAGSPSVLANMILGNMQHVDFVTDLIAHMDAHGFHEVDATIDAEDDWGREVEAAASDLIRLEVDNYMVHVNVDDGSRVFIPYAGGFHRYVAHCERVVAEGYTGFAFS